MRVCTTFPDKAWDIYAKACITSFVKYWPCEIDVYVDFKPDFDHPRVHWHENFSSHPELSRFRATAPKHPKNYLHDAGRFAYKVFAQLETLKHHDRVVWLDADCITFTVPEMLWLQHLSLDCPLVYLGRQRSHTETGFLMFNQNFSKVADFIDRYRRYYTEETIYTLRGWTDCHAFDAARLHSGVKAYNLSPNGKDVDHVFVTSRLGEFMVHNKGNRKLKGFSPEHWWRP